MPRLVEICADQPLLAAGSKTVSYSSACEDKDVLRVLEKLNSIIDSVVLHQLFPLLELVLDHPPEDVHEGRVTLPN